MSTLDLETTRSIADIRKDGLDKAVLERIAAERVEMERAEKEQKTCLPGGFISFREDKASQDIHHPRILAHLTLHVLLW